MLEALKSSPDPQALKDQVKRYLVGIIGNLRHDKKMAEEKKREDLQQHPPPITAAVCAQTYGYPTQHQANGSYKRPYQVNSVGIGKEKPSFQREI